MPFFKPFLFVVSMLGCSSTVADRDTCHSPPLKSRQGGLRCWTSPPYYPSPVGGWVLEWEESYAKAQAVVSNMTLAEKVNLTTGTGFAMGPCAGQTGSAMRFGIPRLCLQDGPLGVRNTDHITAFPAGISVGATFNKKLMYDRGVALGKEFCGKGINVYLGPSVGPLGRKPRGGRNWEGFGMDPSLQGIASALTIKGVQSRRVIATVKHFVGNEQEMFRMVFPIQPIGFLQKPYSSNIDDRTMHELYLWPFAESVRAGVGAVMMAYNDVNSSSSSQNSQLISGILKDELGFQGFTMTDWFAHIGGVSSALAGLDMAMPGDGVSPLSGHSYWAAELSRSVLNGTIPLERLNDMVARIVATWFKLGQDKDFPLPNFSTYTTAETDLLYPGAVLSPVGVVNRFVDVQEDHNRTARAISREAITLLKNEDNLLPLAPNAVLRVFGTDAGPDPQGLNSCADRGCNRGVLTMGWGSGSANVPYLITPQDAIVARSPKTEFHLTDTFPSNSTAKSDDIAIVFINADSGENYIMVEGNPGDRTIAGLYAWHDGDRLITDAASVFSKVVVVVHTVGPIIMEKWIDLPSVKAVLIAHLPGQEAGTIADVLFGDESPSGHLPYTIPKAESDYPESVNLIYNPVIQIQDTFTEGLYIDYRHFIKNNIITRYPFGHGLSYTTFDFSEPNAIAVTPITEYPPARPARGTPPTFSSTIPPADEVAWPQGLNRIWRYLYPYLDNPSSIKPGKGYPYPEGYSTTPKRPPRAGGGEGGNPALWDIAYMVDVKITNTGKMAGRAVAQLYVEPPDQAASDTPKLQLRQFEKTRVLQAGESEVLRLEITRKDLSVWDVKMQDWRVPGLGQGAKLWVGESVEDLRVVCEIGGWCGNA
ncbi:beta-glucosidase [Paracoccidioides lutzii Pb01]|uniref:beta-glucosidase n=1 Tax=Paracoccidioides lutzii (strain ATCC MYA-826 / Pb01) TaxID=502779 RepID=C1GS06_PARBA|nr:beta-glucosidase [Paracoccidioides lutzii Pb01]EEH38380.1 beta-glucosidase [Paracoccidioides lutzii Pb01]